jgi:hypothetical protein
MNKNCKQCGNKFEVRDQDLKFYEKIIIPAPQACPDCRRQRRLAFRNERFLYHRKCDLTGKAIISVYSPDSQYKIYIQDEWWSDKWNPLDFGREFDFSRPFFDQFAELMKVVPRRNLIYFQNENSEYTNCCSNNKDCYLLFSSDYNQGCLYVSNIQKCIDCVDCSIGSESELCYECFNFHHCYKCLFSSNVDNCSDCFAVYDCKGCKNCTFSSGLRNKEFYIYNKPYSQDEYFKLVTEFGMDRSLVLASAREKFDSLLMNQPRLCLNNVNNENCVGDYLYNSKNCFQSFNVIDSESSSYIYDAVKCKDCADCNEIGYSELCYQVVEAFPDTYNSKFVFFTANTSDITYCDHCYNSNNLFGCVGMKRNSYCILNKQYTEGEYEDLMPKIVEHMRKTREWGEFFPINLSPFGYNETVANEAFPLDREQALKLGANWSDYEAGAQFHGEEVKVPNSIKDTDESILEKVLTCEVTGKLYKVIPQEFKFYKKIGLPIPKRSPEQRYMDRISFRNPRKLWDRKCAKCNKNIITSYAPERPEIVYCEDCYLKNVY